MLILFLFISFISICLAQPVTRQSIQSTQQPTQTTDVDFCAGKNDGSYCAKNNVAYTCTFGRTTGAQVCSFCIQSSTYEASCSSYLIPTNFCTLRVSGFYCYRPIGSSIETSVQCDYQKVFKQITCPGFCDSTTGQCRPVLSIGMTPAPCSSSCKYGCTVLGECSQPPFCSDNKVVDTTITPFCGSFLQDRKIGTQVSTFAQDNDARTQVSILSTWNNATIPASCMASIKQFTCESKFLNCDERASYKTCNRLCQDTVKCMEAAMSTASTGVISPINCKAECSSASFVTAIGSVLVLAMLFFII